MWNADSLATAITPNNKSPVPDPAAANLSNKECGSAAEESV